MTEAFDVTIVGAGIVGLATARALQRGGRSVIVLEAESGIARHQTGHNSGVIHSGLYYRPGSMKAAHCRDGRRALLDFCRERGIAYELCGKLVVAVTDHDRASLDELERRAHANGLAGTRRLRGSELRAIEPHAAGIEALHVPEAGIVDYRQVTEALAVDVEKHGGVVRCDQRWMDIAPDGEHWRHLTSASEVRSRWLVNCAGLYSDRVARKCGVETRLRILPFRGEYYRLRDRAAHLVRHLVYPVPDPRFPFLGVHFTRRISGGIEAGPNAVLAWSRNGYRKGQFNWRDAGEMLRFPGLWRMAARNWRTGCAEAWRSWSRRAFVRALQRLVPELSDDDVEPYGSGVRAQAVDPAGNLVDDFVVHEVPRQVHVLNAPSPAATAALAIGEAVAGRVGEVK